jgi:putative alpha-1,2-mannosidase
VRDALLTLYNPSPKGYPGNDDLGTMSAWYVLASLGLYPAIPGTDVLTLGSPLFAHARLRLAGRVLHIRARGASDRTAYVRGLSLRGVRVNRPWVRWHQLRRGGTLEFSLTATPRGAWGRAASDRPPSYAVPPERR